MVTEPLVSVICLCYNQRRFVREAIESVIRQSYKNIQLIVVDDFSTDGSADELKRISHEYPAIGLLLLNANHGNCKAFNKGLTLAKGDYLLDLAADDVLLPDRIEKGVMVLQQSGPEYGVHFSDAELIDENGRHLAFHSDRFPHNTIPQGDIYKDVIGRYFICPPTVFFTRNVMKHLGGYDENLAYEDFDFWIRSSRTFKYCYSPEVLVKKRETRTALAKNQFHFFSKHSQSTYRVCEKIMELNQTKEEQEALSKRIRYETKLNIRLLNISMAFKFFRLGLRNSKLSYAH
jgi:glycosyltransferase involved in cell wall biosynthesis